MCGLCLPHCPTYQLHHSESESPRGRISLMQALASGRLIADDTLQRHLDSCLVCRACEQMCPSKVPYGELIDITRGLLREQGKAAPPAVQQLLVHAEDKKKLQRHANLLRSYQKSGMQKLARLSGLLKVAGVAQREASLPTIPPQQRLAEHYPARSTLRGRVGLFTGCISSLLDGEVHLAAIELLGRIGYEVYLPQGQGCCGSLHQHNGEPERARELAQNNIAAFKPLELDAVISTTSGCAAQLGEYPTLYHENGIRFYEVCDFLNEQLAQTSLPLKPLQQKALLHLSCSQRNVLQRPDAVAELLSRIPELELEAMAENQLCCGSAGSYQLSQPDNAQALLQRKLEQVDGNTPLIVSNNLGCALHLQQGLLQRGMTTEVIHPLILLHRALA